jgi:hypothetical protein
MKISNRGINEGEKREIPGMLSSLLKETYHTLLSSTTIMIYVKEIFENWTRVVNKNQNTKLSRQVSKNRRRLNPSFFV